ncbi:MAG: nitrogenase component 1 [Elusimicrobia bacterium]|nr:nitrogenase component 1 [Elusimicrobiota bacterium]
MYKTPAAPPLGVRLNPPFLDGVYLAMNALPDAHFLGDGPGCLFTKAERIHGRHDLFSTLLSCRGEHRLNHTGIDAFNVAANTEAGMAAALRSLASRPACGALFMGSMPVCAIVGSDYARIMREALAGLKTPSFLVPRAISGDWLDGYAAVLEALASGLDLSGAKRRKGTVALVGYMMDRNEGDHRGNLRELERMVRALGLEPISIWLSGKPYAHLREARHADAVVSLPHGRRAAAVLAKRLGVPVLEAEMPFGLEGTRRFLELLGREFKREEKAREFIDAELGFVAPRLQWSVPHAFLHRRFAFAGDPLYAPGFVELVEELGGKVTGLLLTGAARHLTPAQCEALGRGRPVEFEPLTADAAGGSLGRGADLVVTNTLAFETARPAAPWLEFGFPSDYTHFLRDVPFLGFRGALAFAARLANEVVKGLAARRGKIR